MSEAEKIKMKIDRLYRENKLVRVNINMRRPKVTVENAVARITGVYPFMFRITESGAEHPRTYSVKYTDVVIGQISVEEIHK